MSNFNICLSCMKPMEKAFAVCPSCGADCIALANDGNQLPAGSVLLGKYLVGRVLGQGGFGITYIGYDLNLGVRVAIKEFFPQGIVSRVQTGTNTVTAPAGERQDWFFKSRERFLGEAQSLQRFYRLPSVINVRDYFVENGTAYIVMEYIEGKTLKEMAAENGGKLPLNTVLGYLRPIMQSLQNVHEAGFLHRDIAPDNIIVRSSDQMPYLIDFGSARQMSTDLSHSLTVSVKHGYAPIEQYQTHGKSGPQTDIYAMCACIYKLVTGITPPQAMDRLLSKLPLRWDEELTASLPKHQLAAIQKGLSIHAEDRQQSMAQLIRELSPRPMPAPGPRPRIIPALIVAIAFIAAAFAAIKLPELSAQNSAALTPSPVPTENPAPSPSLTPKPMPTPSPTPSPTPVPVKILAEGEAGYHSTWSFNSEGVLCISGTEEMFGYSDSRKPPWEEHREEISSVIISDGITAVGDFAFTDCVCLNNVELADSVTYLGSRCFSGCTAIEEIKLPAGVTTIEGGAFYDCSALKEVDLGSSLIKIKDYAFFRCSELSHITLPGSLTDVGMYAFYGCLKLESIFFDAPIDKWSRVTVREGNYPLRDNHIGGL